MQSCNFVTSWQDVPFLDCSAPRPTTLLSGLVHASAPIRSRGVANRPSGGSISNVGRFYALFDKFPCGKCCILFTTICILEVDVNYPA